MKTLSAAVLGISLVSSCGKVTSKDPDAGPDAFVADAGPPPPTLASIDPASGIITTAVTLTGTDFGASQGSSTVSIGGADAAVTSWSDTEIVATVPDLFPGNADVTVTTAGGTSGAQTFRVVLPPMAYVHNDADDAAGDTFDSVTVLAFDPATGELTETGAPVSLGAHASNFGGCSSSARLHEGTRRLFVSTNTGVAVFDIDPRTGALTAVAGSPFVTGATQLYGIDVNAAGTRLFTPSYTPGAVVVMDIDAAGALTEVSGSPFAASSGVDIPMLSQNERFLYVNDESGTFTGMSVSATGALALLSGSPFPGSNAFAAVRRPGHDQIYIPDGGGTINAWNTDPDTGAPTLIAGAPFAAAVPAGQPHHPAFTADGGRLYVTSYGSGHVQGFDVDAAGVPTPIGGSPWDFTATMTDASCAAVSSDGRYMLVLVEGQKQISVFGLAADGTPSQVAGSPFTQTTPAEDASGAAITF